VGLIGKTVLLLYHESDPGRIEVRYEEQSYGFLVALNAEVNSRVRRSTGRYIELIPSGQGGEEQKDKHTGDAQRYGSGKVFGQEE